MKIGVFSLILAYFGPKWLLFSVFVPGFCAVFKMHFQNAFRFSNGF